MDCIITACGNRSFWINFLRGKWSTSHQLAAFEEKLQLTLRQLDLHADDTLPKTSEPALFEPLGVNAQPGAIPKKDLGTHAVASHEDEQVTAGRITAKILPHQSRETIVALS